MKRCPKCNRSFDTSLDFCLEDGSRLISLPAASAQVTTESKPTKTADQTVAFPIAKANSVSEFIRTDEVETVVAKANGILPRSATPTNLIFEYAAIVIALAHNWWQWLYLEKQYMSSIMEYIFSANFLMWLLLLAGGTAVGLFVVRKSERKVFGILSLVILAINLILFLVPRR
jgi:hypothetical protein